MKTTRTYLYLLQLEGKQYYYHSETQNIYYTEVGEKNTKMTAIVVIAVPLARILSQLIGTIPFEGRLLLLLWAFILAFPIYFMAKNHCDNSLRNNLVYQEMEETFIADNFEKIKWNIKYAALIGISFVVFASIAIAVFLITGDFILFISGAGLLILSCFLMYTINFKNRRQFITAYLAQSVTARACYNSPKERRRADGYPPNL